VRVTAQAWGFMRTQCLPSEGSRASVALLPVATEGCAVGIAHR
jgi:hypothetical protein